MILRLTIQSQASARLCTFLQHNLASDRMAMLKKTDRLDRFLRTLLRGTNSRFPVRKGNLLPPAVIFSFKYKLNSNDNILIN